MGQGVPWKVHGSPSAPGMHTFPRTSSTAVTSRAALPSGLETVKVYVADPPSHNSAGTTFLAVSQLQGANACSTKSFSWASTSCEERVSIMKVAKQTFDRPSSPRSMPTSKKELTGMVPSVPDFGEYGQSPGQEMTWSTGFENPKDETALAVTSASVPPFSVAAGHATPPGQVPADPTHSRTLRVETLPPMVNSARTNRSPFLCTPVKGAAVDPSPVRPIEFWKNQAPISALPSLEKRVPPTYRRVVPGPAY